MEAKAVNIYKQDYDVYIGRPGTWGNPFVIGKDGTREEVIAKYEAWFMKSVMLSRIGELKGKRLGCFCKPLACHGDVLAKLANQGEKDATKI